MYICPKCGNPTNYKQRYEYYWIEDFATGVPYLAKRPHGLYHDCRKCSWTDRFAEEPDDTSDCLITEDSIRKAFKKLGVDCNEHEN